MPIYDEQLASQYKDLAIFFRIEGPAFEGSALFDNAKMRLAQRVTGVEQRIKDELDELVQEGFKRGLSPTQIANGTADGSFEGIRGKFADLAQERAQLISRAETGAMQDQASVAAYDKMGVKVCDVIGCEDFVIMPGETYGCNSQGLPIAQAYTVSFHPNHLGAIVPRLENAQHVAMALMFHVEQSEQA